MAEVEHYCTTCKTRRKVGAPENKCCYETLTLVFKDQEPQWETPCPRREDNQHCNCWYDGKPCCACGYCEKEGTN